MGLDDLLISTGVDQLIRLIKERGKVEIGVAAKELKIPMRTAEDWSHVLEEEGLIAIEYKLTKIFLVWKAPTAEYVAEKAGKLEEKAVETKGNIAVLMSKVQKGGAELEGMQAEIARLSTAAPMTPSEVQKMKAELSDLEENYSSAIKSANERLEKLKKKVAALGPRLGEGEGKKKEAPDFEKEIAVLRKFEETLQSQLEENESFFGAFEARVEDFKSQIETGGKGGEISGLKAELAEIKSLRSELTGALEAVAEEQKNISGRIAKLDARVKEIDEKENSVDGAKKKLLELRRMGEDAKKQKAAIASQLEGAIALLKKQSASLEGASSQQSQAEKSLQALKEEYVDISEEVSRAGEELAAKQKEVSARVSSQISSLDSARGGMGKVSKEELEKVSFLIRELKREQSLLEEKVRLLVKESEIIRMEAGTIPAVSTPAAEGKAAPVQAQAAPRMASPQPTPDSEAFVEKIKLSAEEETEFARKRDELRSLIRKMWEESKGDGS
ncbi:Chromosome partition protein Smc [uncultured archaeon]|nr:Chromosome partition protein Smc [uncultured archaeon]